MSDCGESAFYERIDAYVLNALRKCDDFNSLMKNNGGIHPIDLMNSLHRLYKCKEIYNGPRNSDHGWQKDREHGRISKSTERGKEPWHEQRTARSSKQN